MSNSQDYDEARRQFFVASAGNRSAWASWRLQLSGIRALRLAFDRTYGRLYRSTLSAAMVKRVVAPYLKHYPTVMFSRSGTGFSNDAEVRMLEQLGAVRGRDVLLVGAEYGGEIDRLWSGRRPQSVVAIDIGDYDAAWMERVQAGSSPASRSTFLKMDGSHLAFRARSFDLIYSQGVLPHVLEPEAFLDDSLRCLRPGGIFYAFCCPLWETYGGSHVHALAYDHLALADDELLRRAEALNDGTFWWLAKGLFNRLRFRELVDLVSRRFEVVRLGVVESADGRHFRRAHPERWAELRQSHAEEDLLIRLVSIVGQKAD